MADAGTLPLPIEREIYFTSQVTQDTIAAVVKKIIEVNENDKYLEKLYKIHDLEYKSKPIKIYIDSYGGLCYQIMGLLGVMENSKVPIHTIATGAAMSCGFMLLICGHERFAYKYATPLYHQVSNSVWGKTKEIEEELIETKRLQKLLEELTIKKTKITKTMLKENFEKKKDWFMSATEALKYGVIDKIIF